MWAAGDAGVAAGAFQASVLPDSLRDVLSAANGPAGAGGVELCITGSGSP